MKKTKSKAQAMTFTVVEVTDSEVEEFVKYVLEFYEEFYWVEDWEPAPMTEQEVRDAARLVLDNYDLVDDCQPCGRVEDKTPPPFDMGSHPREVVRDIILTRRGLASKVKPEGLEWGELVGKMIAREQKDEEHAAKKQRQALTRRSP